MMELAMKKKSLEDSLRGHSAQLEEEGRIVVVGENEFLEKVKGLTSWYKHFCKEEYDYEADYNEVHEIDDVLTPDEIRIFLTLLDNSNIENYDVSKTSLLISHLIQNSYNNGFNDFRLDISPEKKLHLLGNMLNGDHNNLIKVMIKGETSHALGIEAVNCDFYVEGNVSYATGQQAQDCNFHIVGDSDVFLGKSSKRSKFYLEGNIKSDPSFQGYPLLPDAIDSEVYLAGKIFGNIGDSKSLSRRCIFKTSDAKTLVDLSSSVNDTTKIVVSGKTVNSGNKVIFVYQDGSEELVRDYS